MLNFELYSHHVCSMKAVQELLIYTTLDLTEYLLFCMFRTKCYLIWI